MKRRGPNLSDRDIESIASLIDGVQGHVSWQALIEAAQRRLGRRYTRQALHRHRRIQDAFTRKRSESVGEVTRRSSEVEMLLARIARLESERDRQRLENDRLLEQFARWAYNASMLNVGLADLNKPLPPVTRRSR
jgi:flagellar motor switch protein FliM